MNTIKRDFFGEQITAGDEVAFIRNQYREFERGKIIKVNSQKITIEFERDSGSIDKTQRWPCEVIKYRG